MSLLGEGNLLGCQASGNKVLWHLETIARVAELFPLHSLVYVEYRGANFGLLR